jgi:hypothetical protein
MSLLNFIKGIAIILIRYPRIRLIRGYRTIRALYKLIIGAFIRLYARILYTIALYLKK